MPQNFRDPIGVLKPCLSGEESAKGVRQSTSNGFAISFSGGEKQVFKHFSATRFSKGRLEAESDTGVEVIGG